MHDLERTSHRRFNPLTRKWVLNSPHRLQRPWQGERAGESVPARLQYDPACYLCPGNVRANGRQNPDYESTFAFDNDYPAVQRVAAPFEVDEGRGLFRAQAEGGRCRVVCFSPRHDLDIATMRAPDVRGVIDAWANETEALAGDAGVAAVTVFENRGAMMGASNPHPHSQIWAAAHVPDEILEEREGFAHYAHSHAGACVLCAYVEEEIARAERIVYADDYACALVPFWAVWPFETLLTVRAHRASLQDSTPEERDAIANAMHALTSRYDAVFGVPFPYSMGWHQDEHVHAHYYPPLLRSATVRKYQVGYELLAQPQRDFTPEYAARRLREA